jgi:hypothetical protein
MLADLFRTGRPPREDRPVANPIEPDAAFAARGRLLALRDALAAQKPRPKSRWGEPPVFFFDSVRQAELVKSRPINSPLADPIAVIIEKEIAALCQSVEVRHMARAIPRLREVLAAPSFQTAERQALAEVLAVPDDETVLVIHPERRLGFRFHVRGIADVNQFHVLMLDAAAEELSLPALPGRFATACREVNPVVPAGVPMIAELPFQLLRTSALNSDGLAHSGFSACDHWLWGWEPLAAIPRVDGERVVVLGESAFRRSWEVERRFPAMLAQAELLDVLSPFQVAERLSRLTGHSIPVRRSAIREKRFAKAA